jgi:hypothetical protein
MSKASASFLGWVHPICRLKYGGGMGNWTFAIFKYSSNYYSETEWFFPGSNLVDGIVEGAMSAGMEAYQPQRGIEPDVSLLGRCVHRWHQKATP